MTRFMAFLSFWFIAFRRFSPHFALRCLSSGVRGRYEYDIYIHISIQFWQVGVGRGEGCFYCSMGGRATSSGSTPPC